MYHPLFLYKIKDNVSDFKLIKPNKVQGLDHYKCYNIELHKSNKLGYTTPPQADPTSLAQDINQHNTREHLRRRSRFIAYSHAYLPGFHCSPARSWSLALDIQICKKMIVLKITSVGLSIALNSIVSWLCTCHIAQESRIVQ